MYRETRFDTHTFTADNLGQELFSLSGLSSRSLPRIPGCTEIVRNVYHMNIHIIQWNFTTVTLADPYTYYIHCRVHRESSCQMLQLAS